MNRKDLLDFRKKFGTDYSGQEHTQPYLNSVKEWVKLKDKLNKAKRELRDFNRNHLIKALYIN